MQLERLIPALAKKRRAYLLIVYVAATLCFSQAALAQSGRRPSKDAPPTRPPVTTETTVNPPTTEEPTLRISSVIIGGNIVHDYKFYRSSYLGSAIDECIDRFKERQRPALKVSKGGSMTFNEAKERAKKETDAYVLWLEFVTKDDDFDEMTVSYIDYAVLMPQTAKFLTSGRVYPDKQIVGPGGVLRIPTGPKRSPALIQMKLGAREVASRLMSGGWL